MKNSRTPAQIRAIAVAFAVVIAALTSAAYVMFVRAPIIIIGKTAEGLEDFIKSIVKNVDNIIHMRPKVTIGGITVVETSRNIAELSTVEKPFEHTYSYESTWLGSTKRFKIKGFFVAKAGYDLTKPFSIDVSKDCQSIRATMPPAKLNSVEQTKTEILNDEGFWNKLSDAERQAAINSLLSEAKKSLGSTSLLADADKALMAQLESAIHKSAPSATIVREALP